MKKQAIRTTIILIALALGIYFVSFFIGDDGIVRSALLGRGSAHCHLIESKVNGDVDVYFKSGKMKITNNEYFLILKDDTVYTWSKYEDYGMKFSTEESKKMGAEFTFGDKRKLVNEIKERLVGCSRVSLDDNIFNLPEGMDFYGSKEMFYQEM